MAFKICSEFGCYADVLTKGLCSKHYQSKRKSGELSTRQNTKTCKEEECNKVSFSKGYCQKHYLQKRNSGELETDKETYDEICTVEGCSSKHLTKGLCSRHYQYNRKYGTTDIPVKDKSSNKKDSNLNDIKTPTCKFNSVCKRPREIQGYCKEHYNIVLEESGKPKIPHVVKKESAITTMERLSSLSKAILTPKGQVYQAGKTLDIQGDEYAKKQKEYPYKVCSVISCQTKIQGKGCCKKHLSQFKKEGTLTDDIEPLCTVGNCGLALFRKGYCQKHYEDLTRYGIQPPKSVVSDFNMCKVKGCSGERVEDDLCKLHYEQYLDFVKEETVRLEKKAEEQRIKAEKDREERIAKEQKRQLKLKEFEENRLIAEREWAIKTKKWEEKQKLKSDKRKQEKAEREKHKEERRLETIANYVNEEGVTLSIDSEEYKEKQESLSYAPCVVKGCTDKIRTRGCCAVHYHRLVRTGSVLGLKKKEKERQVCSADTCNSPTETKGYCNKHYQQIKRYGKLTPELERDKNFKCSVEDCTGKHIAKGYCTKHYAQIRRHGKITNTKEEN
ncbi:hypothetical protein COF68_04605 [Bacillus toyonensis]|uniref:hypothetical protein n=1 Tax=Bacillus toyonensis TaxID=155322 RepID=UPI000BFBA569|nr:hypothetical protein [Bacillus toyonensis]PHE64135.1 hypothetical protein COF68_04605 [Bacillus toyonensis]